MHEYLVLLKKRQSFELPQDFDYIRQLFDSDDHAHVNNPYLKEHEDGL